MTTKAITFTETTKGHVVRVNGTVAWFIKEEKIGWITYKSSDGTSFKLIPSNDSEDTTTWGHKTLNDAKKFCSARELNL